MSNALRLGEKAIAPLLDKFPDLVNEISTGGKVLNANGLLYIT